MAPKSITPKPDWDEMMIRRVVCMESRLDEIGQSHAELMGDVEALAEKVGAIEKQLADQQDETSDVEEDLDQIFKRLARLEAYQKGEMPEVCDEAICPKDNIRIVIKRGENKTYSTNSRCPETILEFAAMVLDSMKEA